MPRTYSFTKMLSDGTSHSTHRYGGCALASPYLLSCRIFARRAAARNMPVTLPVALVHPADDMKMRLKG